METQALRALLVEIAHLDSALALLNWDQEVFMPQGAAEARAAILASLSARRHDVSISPTLQAEVARLQALPAGTLDEREQALVREAADDLADALKLPTEFVARYAEATSKSQGIWAAARKANTFADFAPALEEVIKLNQEMAGYLGFSDSPYDALLNLYEPGLTSQQITATFTPLKEALVPLLREAVGNEKSSRQQLSGHIPQAEQLDLALEIATALGYDTTHGRLDLSTHPFSTSFHPTDARITTRVDEDDFWVCLGATIHETGHALYEQGLPTVDFGTPLGQAASTGIHESQSRSFENIIGRSKEFWSYWYPKLQARFPIFKLSLDEFLDALNAVSPSFIRVEADELSYNLHIILRTELEQALIEGKLAVRDLPAAWNAKFKEYFGVEVPSDADGVLQDVHWSCGYFGYFPTYTLGNLYSAQLWHAIQKDIPDVMQSVARADFKPFLGWMREHIHQYGRQYLPQDLLMRATGEPLNPKYFSDYLKGKYGSSSNSQSTSAISQTTA